MNAMLDAVLQESFCCCVDTFWGVFHGRHTYGAVRDRGGTRCESAEVRDCVTGSDDIIHQAWTGEQRDDEASGTALSSVLILFELYNPDSAIPILEDGASRINVRIFAEKQSRSCSKCFSSFE